MAEPPPAPTLVFAWGNPSRGDDALGPMFAEAVQAWQLPGVECLTDFQLQVEHALDLQGRQRVLFVDATMATHSPEEGTTQGYAVKPLQPGRDKSFTTHALSPQAVLQAWVDLHGQPPPPAWLLSIRGHAWELGDAVSPAARRSLNNALSWAHDWLRG